MIRELLTAQASEIGEEHTVHHQKLEVYQCVGLENLKININLLFLILFNPEESAIV